MPAAPRRYTEEDRADALALLEAVYRGDVKRCARALEMPAALLKGWSQGKLARPLPGVVPPDLRRPYPPEALLDIEDPTPRFAPAPDVVSWMRDTFILERSPLYNAEHEHLEDANIGVLWTNVGNSRHGKVIAGQAEMPYSQGGKWLKGRVDYQLSCWFGAIPDFLITLYAPYAAEINDASFAALCEHELLHCGQALDAFGSPKFRDSGAPAYTVRGHDSEEFISIVARYGVHAAAAGVAELVDAASRPPLFGEADLTLACGTCSR